MVRPPRFVWNPALFLSLLTGSLVFARAFATASDIRPPPDWTIGEMRILFVAVDMSDKPGDPITTAEAQTLMQQVDTYYREVSGGLAHVTTTVVPTTLRMPQTTAYYDAESGRPPPTLIADARAAALSYDSSHGGTGQYDSANHEVLLVFNPFFGSNPNAMGSAGGDGTTIYINGYKDAFLIIHELAHCYGLPEGNFWQAASSESAIGDGRMVVYGNGFDNNGPNHFTARGKHFLRWLPAADIQSITASGTYRLYQHDIAGASGVRALVVPSIRPATKSYWIECRRTPGGNSHLQNGVLISWSSPASVDCSTTTNPIHFLPNEELMLLDMTPASFSNYWDDAADSPLVVGQSFVDPDSAVTISTVAVGGTSPSQWSDVRIEFGATGTNHDPVISVANPSVTASARTDTPMPVTVSDPDGDTVYLIWSYPDGTISDHKAPDAPMRWLVGGTKTLVCHARDGRGGGADTTIDVAIEDPLLAWTQRAPGLVSDNLYGVAFGNGRFVAVGSNATIVTSTDGTTWTKLTAPSGHHYGGLTTDGTHFVAVGSRYVATDGQTHGCIAYSADGLTWTDVTPATLIPELYGAACGDGRWVGVGKDGRIVVSTDGLTWTTATSPVAADLLAVGFGEGRFIAGGLSGKLVSSANGTDWTDVSPSTTALYAGVTYRDGVWLATGIWEYWTSSDGLAWTQGTSSGFPASVARCSVLPDSGLLVAFENGGNTTSISEDGVTWAEITPDIATTTGSWIGRAVEANGTIVFVGSGGRIFTPSVETRFTTQPTPVSTLQPGQPLTLSVTCTGDSALTYQWYRNGVAIDGAHGATYTIDAVSAADGGCYRVEMSDGLETISSLAGVVFVRAVDAPPLPTNVAPLIKTTWNNYQWPLNADYPYYPDEALHYHFGNSCGPSTITRLLRYWEFPLQGDGNLSYTLMGGLWEANFGATTYEYDRMPYDIPESAPESVYAATALLSYHAAVAQLDPSIPWNPNSPWNPPEILAVFTQHFGYSPNLHFEARWNYTKEAWIALLKNELAAGRPLMVAARTRESVAPWEAGLNDGHWYTIDGYNAEDKFHYAYGYAISDPEYCDVDEIGSYCAYPIALIGLEPDFHGKTLTLTSPVADDLVQIGSNLHVTWQSSGIVNLDVEYSADDGWTWTTVASGVPAAAGACDVTAPAPATIAAKLRIHDSDDMNIYRRSDGTFEVYAAKTLALTPLADAIFQVGSVVPLRWDCTGVRRVSIEYSTDGGATWTVVSSAAAAADRGSDWTVPSAAAGRVQLRVVDLDEPSNVSASGTFEVTTDDVAGAICASDEETVALYHFEDDFTDAAGVLGTPMQFGMLTFAAGGIGLGQALHIDNSASAGNALIIPANPDFAVSGQWTIETWVKVASLNAYTEYPWIVHAPANGWSDWGFELGLNVSGQTFRALYKTSSGTQMGFPSAGTFELGRWYHLALVGDAAAGELRLYIHDDQQRLVAEQRQDASAANLALWDTGQDIFVGGTHYSSDNVQFDGWLDELRIVRRAVRYERSLALTGPTDGTLLHAGDSAAVTWTSRYTDEVELDYSTNGGTTWTTLAAGLDPRAGTLTVTIPEVTTNEGRLRIRTPDGTVSDIVALSISQLPRPAISGQPADISGTSGRSLQLSVAASASNGATVAYQWYRDGRAIAGATSASYELPSAQLFHAGSYACVVTANGFSVISSSATVTIAAPAASTAKLENLSTRALCQTGDDVLIPGFVINGSGTKHLLLRACGPELVSMGLPTALLDPHFILKRQSDGATLASNDDWCDNANKAEIVAAAASVWAFPFTEDSTSAALLLDLPAGAYTVVSSGNAVPDLPGSEIGVAIVELYDLDGSTGTAYFGNISNRGYVGTGGNIMIPGFVVSRDGSRTFLIRAIGPTLASFNVANTLEDPILRIFDAEEHNILTSDNWGENGDAAQVRAVAASLWAFSLVDGSKDAAFVVTLPPGAYTVQASGVGGTTGVALVEVYLSP